MVVGGVAEGVDLEVFGGFEFRGADKVGVKESAFVKGEAAEFGELIGGYGEQVVEIGVVFFIIEGFIIRLI